MLLHSMSDVNKCFIKHFPIILQSHYETAFDEEFLSHSRKLTTNIDGKLFLSNI